MDTFHGEGLFDLTDFRIKGTFRSSAVAIDTECVSHLILRPFTHSRMRTLGQLPNLALFNRTPIHMCQSPMFRSGGWGSFVPRSRTSGLIYLVSPTFHLFEMRSFCESR